MEQKIFDPNLKERLPNFIIQSLAAGVTVAILIALYHSIIDYGIVIASIGASSFIIFCMPNHITALPRRAIGGHFVGIISGGIGWSILQYFGETTTFIMSIAYGLSVSVAVFLMVSFDAEHAPAAGTAIAVATLGVDISTMFILLAVIFMSLIKKILGQKLVDLV